MDLKRNWAYYGIFIFVVSMQLYFMKCNSGLQKMMPILSRLNENEMGEEYVLVYMAFLTPVIILILYFAEWKDFYVDSYGVLKLSRSVNIYSYVARLLLKIGKQVFTFVVLSVLINYIVDYKYANNHFDKMFFDFFDYFMTIFNMCIFVFLISLYIKRTAAAVVCIIFSIIGNCVLSSNLFRSIKKMIVDFSIHICMQAAADKLVTSFLKGCNFIDLTFGCAAL